MAPVSRFKEAAETLAARGLTSGQIAAKLGMAPSYASNIVKWSRDIESMVDPSRPTAEGHEAHIAACLAEGGFPFAFHWMGETVLVNLDGGFWRHMPKGRAA